MNLYLLSQELNNSYDTYDSCIVAAEDEQIARNIHPGGGTLEKTENGSKRNHTYDSWVTQPYFVKVDLIGIAKEGTERGVVLASFNAG